jgi:glycosyltransferase involved in cell wall biosynthesis
MNILIVHQNFPGQYRHLAPALAADSRNTVVALSTRKGVHVPGVRILVYGLEPKQNGNIHPLLSEQEIKVQRGQAVANAALELRREGFRPDVICVHPGWGEALFLKDVWPLAKILCYCEFYYRDQGSDVGFDTEFDGVPDFDLRCRLRMKNVHFLVGLEASDQGVSPTAWQRAQFPLEFQSKIQTVFDGIDTSVVGPGHASITLKRDNIVLGPDDEVLTFVARNLEPYRGFHIFMRALPEILRLRPKARAVIVGGDDVSYGKRHHSGKTYRQVLLEEVGAELDLGRVHFVGKIPYASFLDVLRISSAHVYLTYPFVLSWSMLEAMSARCLVLASDTAPVREVVRHGENGLLFDFFDVRGLSRLVADVLAERSGFAELRGAARRTIVERYDLKTICLPKQMEIVGTLAGAL